jgi:hypothetical protein
MKKLIFLFAIIATTLFASCKSNSEKQEDALENVVEANENLDKVNQAVSEDQITKANDTEWQTYKTQANKTISENEARILELQAAIRKPGNSFDEAYKKSIIVLAEKNTTLKTQIINYENNQTDWETFKREFDSDMDGLGQAFKELTINNKN